MYQSSITSYTMTVAPAFSVPISGYRLPGPVRSVVLPYVVPSLR